MFAGEMAVTKIDSAEAIRMHASGALYLDVRSIPEFEAGHAPGAYNIPLMHAGPGGMRPNPAFAEEVAAAIPRDVDVVVACKAGGRSAQAVAQLGALGFTRVFDFGGGWHGNPGDPGWVASGGPQTTATEPGRSHRELAR